MSTSDEELEAAAREGYESSLVLNMDFRHLWLTGAVAGEGRQAAVVTCGLHSLPVMRENVCRPFRLGR